MSARVETLRLMYQASEDKHSIELTQFDKLYLSLNKQLLPCTKLILVC